MTKGVYPHKPYTDEMKKKMSIACRGINLGTKHHWKGDKVGKRGVHLWVEKWKGKPDTCEGCGKTGLTGFKINWANVDHQYKRVLDDYIRLCTKCHGAYDTSKGFRKRLGLYIRQEEILQINPNNTIK